jgi:hypothetical protein
MTRTNEAAFETVIEGHLLANGYVTVNRDGFDRVPAVFPAPALAFIRTTQPKEWGNLDARRQNVELYTLGERQQIRAHSTCQHALGALRPHSHHSCGITQLGRSIR